MAKERIRYFDIFKGIGIIYMILGHASAGGEIFSHYIHAFHMPLFFFVSGYFFSEKKYLSLWQFVAHEVKSLMVPYTFFAVLCQLLHYLYTKEYSFSYFILSYFTSNHNRIDVAGAYWFLLCLFSARIIFYLIERMVISEKIKIVIYLMLCCWGSFSKTKLPLCLDSAFTMIFLLFLGKKMREYKEAKFVMIIQHLKIWQTFILLIVNAILIMLNGIVNVRTNTYENVPFFWCNCLVAIVCYLNISRIIEEKNIIMKVLGRPLQYIGANSMVYLTTNEIMLYVVSLPCTFLLERVGIAESLIIQKMLPYMIALIATVGISLIVELSKRFHIMYLFGK
jgi:fucose 4-O-acetylase-like acetyltransferase